MLLDRLDKNNRIVIGLDLANEHSQVSYCRLDRSVPDTVSLVMGEEQYNIPTPTEIWGADETAAQAQEAFIRKLLSLVAAYTNGEACAAIAVTMNEMRQQMCDMITHAAKAAAGEGCEVYFLSRQDCFFQYLLHQPQEMWTKDVLLYEYRLGGVRSYSLTMNRQTSPVACFIEEDYFPQMKMAGIAQMGNDARRAFYTQLDSAFLEIIRTHCEGRSVTSVFLLGDIFSTDWCKESLRCLCKGRRVFQGNNLYSKGACYGARERIAPSTLASDYVYLSEDKLRANIGMNCNRGQEEIYQPLLSAGTNWYEAKCSMDIILARDNTLSLLITPLDGNKPKTAHITLDGLTVRGNRTNRVGLSLCMQDASTVGLELVDKGFGAIFPSSGRTWKESFEIS